MVFLNVENSLKCGCGGQIIITKHNRPNGEAYFTGHCEHILCPLSVCLKVKFNTDFEAIAAFKRATRADVKQGIDWISVKNRLPDKFGNYLVAMNANYVTEFLFHDGEFWDNGYSVCCITHWAEINLPEKE